MWHLLAPLGPLLGWGLIKLMRIFGAMVTYICPKGLVQWRGAEIVDTCRWDEIQAIAEERTHNTAPLKGPAKLVPVAPSTSVEVSTKDGASFGFNGLTMKGIQRFAELIRLEATARNIRWTIVEK
jgi:hypothetical protein